VYVGAEKDKGRVAISQRREVELCDFGSLDLRKARKGSSRLIKAKVDAHHSKTFLRDRFHFEQTGFDLVVPR